MRYKEELAVTRMNNAELKNRIGLFLETAREAGAAWPKYMSITYDKTTGMTLFVDWDIDHEGS